jgi:hypothetical protein
MRDETVLLLAGGALALGVIVHRKLAADAAALQGDDTAAAGSDWFEAWSTPAPGGATWPAPAAPAAPAAPGPVVASSPPTTAPAPTPAETNAAYADQRAAAIALQQSDYEAQVAELRARVASGAVTVGSPYYDSTMAYLTNMRGGVATAAAELDKLHAAGLAGARGPRLAWSRPRS